MGVTKHFIIELKAPPPRWNLYQVKDYVAEEYQDPLKELNIIVLLNGHSNNQSPKLLSLCQFISTVLNP